MKKTAIFLALCLLTSACASYTNSLSYRPRNSDSAPYVINSKINQLDNTIQVFIDGHEVINGRLSFWDGSGNFFGEYEKHKINADCGPNVNGCRLLIDNEFVGEFK